MGTGEKILLGFLLAVLAAFPIAFFLYLRTAYRKDGWAGVKTASAVAGTAFLIWAALPLWGKYMAYLGSQVIEHPFRLTTIVLIALSWLLHHGLKAWAAEKHDHH